MEAGAKRAGTLALADFDYHLPAELIAQWPAPRREDARLLALDRSGPRIEHKTVAALPELLRRGDLLVFNDTKVRAARLRGRTASGGRVEILALHESAPRVWECLGKPAKRLRPGTALIFPGGVTARVRGLVAPARYAIAFPAGCSVPEWMEACGEVPLPPYIKRSGGPVDLDRERYQTVFAAVLGAVAAPTAGLHFTAGLLAALRRAGVETAWLTLHVGPGTFLPVREEAVEDHRMDPEWADVPDATAECIRRAKARGGRVVAVGTTTVRALESAATAGGALKAGAFWAATFIVPGFGFRVVDALMTNFHLPRSTLLMLVSAFAGRRVIADAYEEAIRERYRFYSYGDAMLIY